MDKKLAKELEDKAYVRELCDDITVRAEIIDAHIPDPEWKDTVYKPYNFLADAQNALKDAFMDWEIHKDNDAYITYIAGYRSQIADILAHKINFYKTETEQYQTDIGGGEMESAGGVIDEEDEEDKEDLAAAERLIQMFSDPNVIVARRDKVLEGLYVDSDVLIELLWALWETDFVLPKSGVNPEIETKEEWQEKMAECLDFARKLYPGNQEVYIISGIFLLHELKNPDGAMNFATTALHLDEMDEEAQALYAEILLAQNKYDEAYTYIMEHADLDINNYTIDNCELLIEWYDDLLYIAKNTGNIELQLEYAEKIVLLLEKYVKESGLEHTIMHSVKNGKDATTQDMYEVIQEDRIYSTFIGIFEETLPNFETGVTKSILKKMETALEQHHSIYFVPILAYVYDKMHNYKKALHYYEVMEDYISAGDCYFDMEMYEEAFYSYDLMMSKYVELSQLDEEMNFDIDFKVYEKAWEALLKTDDTFKENDEYVTDLISICDNAINMLPIAEGSDKDYRKRCKRLAKIYYQFDYINQYEYDEMCQSPLFWSILGKEYLKNNNPVDAITSFIYAINPDIMLLPDIKADLQKAIKLAENFDEKDAAEDGKIVYNAIKNRKSM